ncbi:MAG TPA: FAD-dependent oxidoreductase, partial [Candidatus Paceibacterota bacterium]|nr:FAD-dependent oxidoreductase [Candidatus Paceibacterota bacterium]
MKSKRYFRRIILALVFLLLIFIARPITFLVYTYFRDKKPVKKEKTGYVNDASNLNETKMVAVVKVPDGIDAATAISQLIKKAKIQGLKISIAGAQHSMGGYTIYPGGIQLDMKGFHYMEFDSLKNILLVGSGALWSEIVPFLDKRGKSIAVMQSNNSFSVGGSISVNCHGWQPNSPPISSTIESLRIINADGEILTCSKNENPELFSLAIGGYGLFGVILD